MPPTDSGAPVLVLCAHGTRSPRGRSEVGAVAAAVRARRPDIEVRLVFVDVQKPTVADVVPAEAGAGRWVVVVPLLLAAGFHVHVDIGKAVTDTPTAVATPALGPDERLADLVVDRMKATGAPRDTHVILVPAGSSDARAQADSATMADLVGQRWGSAVSLAFAAGPSPSAADAVAAARADGAQNITLASYLLAPGFFQDRLTRSGADLVTDPLLPDDRIVDIVLDRYYRAY